MRMLEVAALVAISAAAAAAQADRPLEASLRHGSGEGVFYIDQPAYVVVFEVIPGQGVQQIYPRSSYESTHAADAGEYLLSRPFRSQYNYAGWNNSMPYARPIYMLDGAGRIASYYYETGWTGSQSFGMVRTLLLVASRKPLRRVGSPEGAQHWLQQVVGFRAISNSVYAPEAMLDDIVNAVTPAGAGVDDVVVDMLEIADDMYRQQFAVQSVQFRCPSGVYTVSAEFYFGSGMFVCPGPRPTQAQQAPPTTPGADSGKTEDLRFPARKIPPKTDAQIEDARVIRRGIGSTPATPSATLEEGYRVVPRGVRPTPAVVGAPADEGYRSYRHGVQNPAAPGRATIVMGAQPPMESFTGRAINTTGAWVPPSRTLTPSEQGYRAGSAGDPSASGGYRGGSRVGTTYNGTSSATGSSSGSSSASSGTSGAAASAPTPSTSSSSSGQTASQAQSSRSAESRAAVGAAASSSKVPPTP